MYGLADVFCGIDSVFSAMFILSIFILSTVHLDKANGIGSEEKKTLLKFTCFLKFLLKKILPAALWRGVVRSFSSTVYRNYVGKAH